MFWQDVIVSVRYCETDKMGIVHHSNYPIWFEIGRTEFSKFTGLPYSQLETLGLAWPLINLGCSYKSPAFYDDEVIIRTCLKEVSYTRITFSYQALRKSDEKLLCHGTSEHVWADEKLKPINAKKTFPHVYETYKKYCEQDSSL